MKFNNSTWMWCRKLGASLVIIQILLCTLTLHAKVLHDNESETALFNNLPRVALLVKEQYVDPKRINPDAMLASILEALELRITKLVVSLPKTLEKAREQAKALEEKPRATSADKAPKGPAPQKEKLVLDLGGTKRTFEYEPQKSIW
ncbi:MAG TPA: hypothetical protein VEL47_03770, partial [Myxococcota bacterium]|nr:hypothetical protein [Myxococcota bacterium]